MSTGQGHRRGPDRGRGRAGPDAPVAHARADRRRRDPRRGRIPRGRRLRRRRGLGVRPCGAHVLRARWCASDSSRSGLRRRGVIERARGRRSGLRTRHALGRLAVAGPERRGPPARGARQAGRQLRSTAARSVRAGGDARRLRDGHARPADAVTLTLLETRPANAVASPCSKH